MVKDHQDVPCLLLCKAYKLKKCTYHRGDLADIAAVTLKQI